MPCRTLHMPARIRRPRLRRRPPLRSRPTPTRRACRRQRTWPRPRHPPPNCGRRMASPLASGRPHRPARVRDRRRAVHRARPHRRTLRHRQRTADDILRRLDAQRHEHRPDDDGDDHRLTDDGNYDHAGDIDDHGDTDHQDHYHHADDPADHQHDAVHGHPHDDYLAHSLTATAAGLASIRNLTNVPRPRSG